MHTHAHGLLTADSNSFLSIIKEQLWISNKLLIILNTSVSGTVF